MTDTKTDRQSPQERGRVAQGTLADAICRAAREGDPSVPFSGEYEHEHRKGTYTCAGCGQTAVRIRRQIRFRPAAGRVLPRPQSTAMSTRSATSATA